MGGGTAPQQPRQDFRTQQDEGNLRRRTENRQERWQCFARVEYRRAQFHSASRASAHGGLRQLKAVVAHRCSQRADPRNGCLYCMASNQRAGCSAGLSAAIIPAEIAQAVAPDVSRSFSWSTQARNKMAKKKSVSSRQEKRVLASALFTTPITDKQRRELKRLAARPDSQIDFSDAPERQPRASDVQVGRFYRPIKQLVSLRVDADVLHWFRGRGKKYQTYMNEVLRREMETNERGQ